MGRALQRRNPGPRAAFVRHQTFGVAAMTNSRVHAAIALGSAMIAVAFVAFVPPIPPASAQSQAQRICREQGVSPGSDGYEYCLSQATRALYWGEPAACAQLRSGDRQCARRLPGLRAPAADHGLPDVHRNF